MLLRNDVVNLMWQVRILFVQETVFAATGCPLSRLSAEEFWNVLLVWHGNPARKLCLGAMTLVVRGADEPQP